MDTDILVAVSSPPELDFELYINWINGNTIEQAYHKKLLEYKKYKVEFELEFHRINNLCINDTSEFIRYEVIDQYRTFEALQHFLSQPLLLKTQCLIIIKTEYQASLIDYYWHLDDKFVREVLNKRLARSRKDLEDVADTTGLNLHTITRQFDNIKRIFNSYEDSTSPSVNNIYVFITKNYLLSHSLAQKYTCIIFLLISRFNLSSKKRLLHIECCNLVCYI